MSYEPKDYEAIERHNKMMISRAEKEELKQTLLSSGKIPPIIKEVLEEREVLLEWIDAILIQNGINESTLAGPGAKGFKIWSAWGPRRAKNRP
jgi:hypothetical protein